jgi:GH25 family lysozyme M1 (1,4-beta-N-acetylmuramidase)
MRSDHLLLLLAAGCTATDPTPEATIDQSVVACARGQTIEGIDVSYHDGSIDWSRVRADGIDFAFIRASDGLDYIDNKFDANWAGARGAGVIRGAYQFFRPSQDPIAQADLVLERMGPLQDGDLPPVLDVETSSGLPADEVIAGVRVWIDYMTDVLGRPPIIYAGLYSWEELTGNADMTESPLWVAQWTTASCPNIPSPWQTWMFWQYSEDGWVDGIGETVDVDRYDGSREDLLAFAIGNACGDGACNSGETTATCDVDCPPCGTIDPAGATIDDGDACFLAGGPDQFLRPVTGSGEGGDLLWTHTTADDVATNFAKWTLYFAEAGRYRVEAYTAREHARSRRARYVIEADGATTSVVLDQSAVDGWQSLGEHTFAARGGQSIVLGDNTGEAGADDVELAFDAVRLTRLDAPPDDDGDGDDDGDDDGGTRAGCSAGGGTTGGAIAWVLGLAAVTARRARRMAGRKPCDSAQP